jgi:Nucleotide modification associated domain 3
MQIILSRKGFDTQYGGQASPIMPDGTLLSIPIPAKNESIKFSNLNFNGKTYLEIIKELNPNTEIKDNYTCHLDPDLRNAAIKREKNWLPVFGQTGSAQGHLLGKGIKEGDLFLFFGWFKETEILNGILKYKRNAPDMHLIFGYLQIGSIYSDIINLPKELQYHPHAQKRFTGDKNNCIYKAAESLSFSSSNNGAGCLFFHDNLVLTKKGYSKSRWELPEFFRDIAISYHTPKSFTKDYFQSASKGQEFIIEENRYVSDWARKLIINGTKA